jgi:outer membrane lipoprotein-sorting protein
MTRCRLFILTLAALLLLPALAGADSNGDGRLTQLLAEIRQKSNQFESLTCKFTQERHLSLFKAPVVVHGTLAISRPDRLRWQYAGPIPSVLIFNGNSGLRCTGNEPPIHFDLDSAPIMRMVAEQLRAWLNGNYQKLEESYSISLKDPSTLLITPKEKTVSSSIQGITISFTDKDRQPKRVEITEPGGDDTIIVFADYSFNARLPAATFSQCDLRD